MKTTTHYRRYFYYIIFALALAVPVYAQAAGGEQLQQKKQFIGLVQSFLEVIEGMHGVYSNPEKATIFQLQKVQEIYKKKGERAKAAEVYKSVLENSKNRTIRNSAYTMLADLLKDTGQPDEAIKVLKKGIQENLEASK